MYIQKYLDKILLLYAFSMYVCMYVCMYVLRTCVYWFDFKFK